MPCRDVPCRSHLNSNQSQSSINPKLGVGLVSRESMGSKTNNHQETKLEIHLLLGLGARFQNLSTESSITDGNCGILIKNNEGNRQK